MRFYSERGEDKAVATLFEKEVISQPFFVDVGAYDGIRDSNTYYFELMGWKGICIEPHPHYSSICKRNRPNSLCLKLAAWHENGESNEFYATMPGGASRIGRLDDLKKTLEMYPTIELGEPLRVTTKTLNSILREYYAPPRFELLSIDVEGTEMRVLAGFELESYLPRVVVIEYNHIEGERSRKPHQSPPRLLYDYFDQCGYSPVNNTKSHNAIFCRDFEDAKKVALNWEWKGARGYLG